MSKNTRMQAYADLIKNRSFKNINTGFDIDACDLNIHMKHFQREIVKWALKRGRSALFEGTGLGKTIQTLSWADEIANRYGPVLIVSPLCVSEQTVSESLKFGIDGVKYSRTGNADSRIVVTNYEMIDHFNADDFCGVALDESSILKNQTGKMRQLIIDKFCNVPYRLSCTATPAPNDYMELGSQAEFLGIMTATEMLSMFFVHDGGDTSKWRLKGHGRVKFWEWLATWSIVIRKPSDIGFDDDGYDLPPLRMHEHIVETKSIPDKGMLFAMPAKSLSETRKEQRNSIFERASMVAEIVNNSDESWVIWCHLNDESSEITRLISDAIEVKGSHSVDQKQSRIMSFTNGESRCICTKTSIAGFGMNWQHCRNEIFVGLSYSWESFYQAIRREWRFGQERSVNIHIVRTSNEGHVMATLNRKQDQADQMLSEMVSVMGESMKSNIKCAEREVIKMHKEHNSGENWEMYLGDCVDAMSDMEDESIDYSIFSPPFASLYTYSNSDYDMGNTSRNIDFFKQFKFCVEHLFRLLKPGRLLSFHCMNLPTSKQRDGVIGLSDFRGELIRMFVDEGFIYHSEVTIWKDPVTAMQRTKALGLLWKQIKKDSSMCRQGLPDYLVTVRKPGSNNEPISHTQQEFPVDVWQRYASPVWMDINQSDTLNKNGARENDDERHICPLQLGVIRRSMKLWTNPGDTVLTPFAGIGSEVFVAIQEGRKGIVVELKKSYYDVAIKNCTIANAQLSIFDKDAIL